MPEPTRVQRLAVALAYEGVKHEHQLCVWELEWVDGKPARKGTESTCESLERLAKLLAGATACGDVGPGGWTCELPHGHDGKHAAGESAAPAAESAPEICECPHCSCTCKRCKGFGDAEVPAS